MQSKESWGGEKEWKNTRRRIFFWKRVLETDNFSTRQKPFGNKRTKRHSWEWTLHVGRTTGNFFCQDVEKPSGVMRRNVVYRCYEFPFPPRLTKLFPTCFRLSRVLLFPCCRHSFISVLVFRCLNRWLRLCFVNNTTKQTLEDPNLLFQGSKKLLRPISRVLPFQLKNTAHINSDRTRDTNWTEPKRSDSQSACDMLSLSN